MHGDCKSPTFAGSTPAVSSGCFDAANTGGETMIAEPITITNCGPIQHCKIPCPKPGEIIVLRGRNGSGKTTILQHVESAINGRGKGNLRDGENSGEVDAFGVTLKLGRSTRRSGELQVESLEGKFDISHLIDPGIKDPVAADAVRIKALVQIANVLPCPDLFYELVGGQAELEKLVSGAALSSKDLVVMAERIKRDLEAAARREEDAATLAEGKGRGAREAAAGVDVEAECDSDLLSQQLNDAIRAEERLKAERDAAVKAKDQIQTARDQLADAEATYGGLSVADALSAEQHAQVTKDAAEAAVKALEEQLRTAKQKHIVACNDFAAAIQARKTAESHEASMQAWRNQLDSVLPIEPPPEEIAEATAEVARCNAACDQGTLIRKAKEQLIAAEQHFAIGSARRKRSLELRDAAKGTDDVLSGVVAKSGQALRVEGSRLVLETDRRGKTFFHELSAGERARIAIDIGIDAMPANKQGVIILSQEIWEGLDPLNRDGLQEHIATRPVGLLTAEASEEEEITPEAYGHVAS